MELLLYVQCIPVGVAVGVNCCVQTVVISICVERKVFTTLYVIGYDLAHNMIYDIASAKIKEHHLLSSIIHAQPRMACT